MKPLILGAGGILGRSLCLHFRAVNTSLVALGRAELDITRTDEVVRILEQHKPDVVINTAAMTSVDRCETEREMAFAANAGAPAQLAELCRRRGIRFVHISTDYVFDGAKKIPYTEDDPPSPISAYAESKAEGDRLVLAANPASLIVRVAWTFHQGGKTFLCRLRELIFTQTRLEVANDRTGNCTYAPDLAAAIDVLIQREVAGLVHFTNEGELSWFDFATALLETARSGGMTPCCREILSISSASLNLPARRPPYSVLDKSRYRRLTGNSIRHWRDTLPDYLRENA